ncbi:pupal cuticle protein 20-like isoform X1 [Vespa velutina]|uniref:pupal cuticle protein 20-like isoform X1 n=1 Tax=Vespa velutina TaxID=202808 RepID=UPI001FB2D529|nr:pupal cuticle protein 20-like isoform X1 [Vespa velutina]XP_047349844.1 pupal cuticle protein 20-like isoform X1 [Vespa velutina]XP_047349845.1 pupal cuticle protein 20-like isoform X1 [Vespa velutina]XP_047349846.1 pupal cuticle protein 20-like isoform X1 [Vespa velutina]
MRPQLVVTLLALASVCYAARLENTYLPPGSAGTAGGAGFIKAPNRGGGSPGSPGRPGSFTGRGDGSYQLGSSSGVRPGDGVRPGGGADIPIISFNNENSGDGNYQFSYETGNGISAQETGQLQGESEAVSGSFSYTGPDGVQYSITYTADEEGFHPQGAHLPTPPPIPPEIQRGVELSLAAEARGENQDGGGYGDGNHGGRGGGNRGGSYQGPNSYQTSSGVGTGGYQY